MSTMARPLTRPIIRGSVCTYTIAHANLLLYKPTPDMPGADSYEAAQARTGKNTGILLSTDDINATYKELSARGVNFPTPPEQQAWG